MYSIGNACMMKQWIIDNVDISTVRRCFKCGVAISAGTGVYISAVDGKIYPYTSTTKDTYVGIAEDSGMPNKFIDVVTHGYLKVPGSGWAAGLVYYVNNGGGLTAGAGDTAAAVGYAEDAIIVYTGKGSDAVIVLGTGNLSSVRKCSNNVSTGACSITLGYSNTSSSVLSATLGGAGNVASGDLATIVGGDSNTASCIYSFIGNGTGNEASGVYSAIVNGSSNTSSSYRSFIGNGSFNTASNSYASVINGGENCATNQYSFVGNGNSNTASGTTSTVVNGSVQQAFGDNSFIGAGYNNLACSCTSVVLAGCQNQLYSSSYGVINNGIYNILCNSAGEGAALYAFIGNGTGNNTTGGIYSNCNWAVCLPTFCDAGCYSFIGNGFQNRTPGLNATVLNGCCNVSDTQNATILNGFCNSTNTEQYQFVANGVCNSAGSRYATVLNGLCNTISGRYNTIGNGDCNTIVTAVRSFIGSGNANGINIAGFTGHAFIGGGIANCVTARRSNIVGGRANIVSNSAASIVGGCLNTASGYYSFLGGGYCNVVAGYSSVLGGGLYNTAHGPQSFLGGGNYNKVCTGCYSSVAGGVGNNTTGGTWNGAAFTAAPTVNNIGSYSFIGGGFQNRVSSDYSNVVGGCCNVGSSATSSVVGGVCNTSSNTASFIGGGMCNTASGTYSGVFNGKSNIVSGTFSAILSGQSNTVSGSCSTVVGGCCNTVSGLYSSTLSGYRHTICSGVTSSFIGSGRCNTMSSWYSAIASGEFNCILLSSHDSFIGAGFSNTITNSSGTSAMVSTTYSTISCSNCSFIGSGSCHSITTARLSNILGGYYNKINGTFVVGQSYNNAAIVNGIGNNTTGGAFFKPSGSFCVIPTICCAGDFSFIGNGFQNVTSGCHSSVVSGCQNTASACYSSVLNGYNNVVSGAFSAASGCGLVASCACTFYTNNHCACGSLAASTLTPGSAVCVTAGGTLTNYVPVGAGITLYYGSFYSTVTQTATNPNQEYLMTLNTTTLSNGVTISGSQITIANAGVYNIQFSAQIKHTSGGTASLDIWFKKNGTNITDTNTKVVASNNTEEVAAWNIVESFTAGQYVELAWNSNVGGVQLLAAPAQTGPVRPGIPSVIVTVTRVG